MDLCPLLVFFSLSRFLVIKSVLAALPDLVVHIAPSKLSQSNSQTIGNDEASIEILAKRAAFGSRDHYFEGIVVRPPEYDSLLCERYKRTVDIDQFGNIDLVVLPPYSKQDEKNSTVMLVPRGECSFERKAYAAKHFYGAKGIMIYDNLSARYGWNTSNNDVIFPHDKVDYDCVNGNTVMKNLPLDPPAYNATHLDLLMGSAGIIPTKASNIAPTNRDDSSSNVDVTTVCNLTNTALKPCESQLCLVTSHSENSTDYPVCCAWDTPVTMPIAQDAKDLDTDDILALWITIRQAELIFQSDFLSFGSEVSIETRGSKSAFNATYVIMWIWGTMVMMVGAWYAARDYRIFGVKLTAYRENKEKTQTSHRDRDPRRPRRRISDQPNELSSSEKKERTSLQTRRSLRDKTEEPEVRTDLESGEHIFQDEDQKLTSTNRKQKIRTGSKQKTQTNRKKSSSTKQDEGVWSLHSLPPPERKRKKKVSSRASTEQNGEGGRIEQTVIGDQVQNETSTVPERESRTITPFEMTQWHVLCLIVMTSLTLVLLFFFKIYTLFFILYGISCAVAICYLVFNPLVAKVIPKLGNSWVEEFNKPVVCGCNGFSITSQLISYIWVGVWMWYGMTHHRPQTNVFFWISLNILGASVCILSVSVMKLTSIKIATLLLVAIFVYDIFFVFITPFLTPGGASVMLQVATGSGNPAGEDFCYKYPDDKWCKGIGFLPMLFIFPKVNDYANGSVLLGLGDIILPGFLIAFSARHDEAVRLINEHMTNLTNSDIKRPTKWYEGYFFPMMLAYSSGLLLAFVAVILMEQGQPALLYICPICLITILILGRRDIKNLWNGVKVLKQADFLITKTEREWGKSRMKRFTEQRRRENAAMTTSSQNKQDTIEISPKTPTNSQLESSSDRTHPRPKDIYFGHENHPGTRFLRSIVEQVTTEFGEEEYKPEIFKVVKRKLRGRRFFIKKESIWEEASKLETRKHIGRAYDRARGRRSAVLDDKLLEA